MDPSEMHPHREDSIARLLEKMEAKLQLSFRNEDALRKFGWMGVEERRAEWRGVIDLLQRALADDSLADDARLEVFRVQANEVRAGAIWMLTASQHFRDPLLRERWCAERAELGEFLDEMLEMFEEGRPLVLALLPSEDLDRLREQGFLRPGE